MEKTLCLSLFIVIYQSFSYDLPSYFPRCYIDDPNLNECILNATRILKPYVRNGIKEIKLPSLDPLNFTQFTIIQENDVVNVNATLTKPVIRGFDDYEFTEISFNPDTLKLEGKVMFHTLHLDAEYSANTKLFYFPVIGNGTFEAHYGSPNGSFEVSGKLVQRNNTIYYRPTSTKVLTKIQGFTVRLTGLFGNNEELGYVTNELVNLNGQAIIDVTTPVIERTAEMVLMRFVKTLTRLVPYEKLFPKSSL